MRLRVVLMGLAILPACSSSKKNAFAVSTADAGPVKVQGVIPDRFDCKAFLPDVATIAGGEVEWLNSEFSPQQGTSNPCIFQLTKDPTRSWQFAIDCRKVAGSDLDLVLRQKGAEPDTRQLQLGKRAIEHSRAQIIFEDKDTPCMVWLVGFDEASRMHLAQVVESRLTVDNAPTYPRGKRDY